MRIIKKLPNFTYFYNLQCQIETHIQMQTQQQQQQQQQNFTLPLENCQSSTPVFREPLPVPTPQYQPAQLYGNQPGGVNLSSSLLFPG